ncbi:hypothetical protein Tco_1228908 [Tanacetum coccineum]
MRIPPWMITEEMKLTEHYKMYAEVFGLDVPLIQSQPTESTQGTHRTLSAPRSPNPATETAESNMIQVSLAEQKSHEEKEARENVAQVAQHLAVEEIEKLVEESENEKEEETTKDTEVEQNIIIPVNVDDEEDEITDEVFNLRRRAKGKNERSLWISPILHQLDHLESLYSRSSRSDSFLCTKVSQKQSDFYHDQFKTKSIQRYKTSFHEITRNDMVYLFAHLKKRFMPRTSSDQLADNLHDVMMETLPSLVKEKVTEQVKKEVHVQVRNQVPVYLAEGLIMERKLTKEETERLISKAILQERGHMQAQISSQIQNAIDNAIPSLVDASVRNYMSGHILHVHPAQVHSSSIPEQQHQLYLAIKAYPSVTKQPDISILVGSKMKFEKTTESSSRQVNVEEPGPSTLGNQEQDDDCDFGLTSYCFRDDDEIPTKKKGNSGLEKLVLSLHKFPAIVFNDDDIEERTSRWVNKCIKKFNPYARYGLLWSLSVFIRSSVIWERMHDFQLGIKSYQQKINLNPVREKGDEPSENIILVMQHWGERLKTKELLKDVKYGYVQKELTHDELEFLKLFEEEIEVRSKYQDQMKRWEMYMNGRLLGLRRERPE